ncbi:type IV pilus biogenesis protein PilP [Paraburkholderia sediminicola]|uniref:type IV pilus biogenesis protein PilP n=1 Tax=Paraburkholderia sediminicola TaxID=458836 RepID=UPI0038BDEFF9
MKTCINLRHDTVVKLVGAALALASSVAFAATATSAETATSQGAAVPASGATAYQMPTWSTYYGAVDAIRADTQKAQAELDNLQIHHQIDEARRGNFSQNGGNAAPGTPALPTIMSLTQPSAPVATPVTHDPLVQQVSMVDNRWAAVIQLSSGARVRVHEGEAVRGLGTVAHIALGEVTVTQGGKVTALQFGGDGSQDAPQANTPTIRPISGAMPTPISMH